MALAERVRHLADLLGFGRIAQFVDNLRAGVPRIGRRQGGGTEALDMSKLGKRLIQAAQEGVAIARGELDPATYRVHAR
jgi:hypothetical protein